MKAFNVNDFTSELNKRGAAKSHNFAVALHPPPKLMKLFPSGVDWLPLRIEAVNLPSRSLMTLEQRYHGPVRYMPYSVIYTPVTLTVILSDNMIEREMFMAWQDIGASVPDGPKDLESPRRGNFGTPGKYDSSYYDDIKGTVEIYQFPEMPGLQGRGGGGGGLLGTISGVAAAVGFDPSIISRPLGFDIGSMFGGSSVPSIKHTGKITLNEAYPRTVNEVSMNWASDEIAKLQVEIMYFDFEEDFVKKIPDAGGGDDFAGNIRKGLNMINKFKPAVSGLIKGGGGSLLAGAKGGLTNVGASVKVF